MLFRSVFDLDSNPLAIKDAYPLLLSMPSFCNAFPVMNIIPVFYDISTLVGFMLYLFWLH